eukprot:PITA_18555
MGVYRIESFKLNGQHSKARYASDRIVLGSSLTGNQTRISKGGMFKFGFFNLNHNNVEKWYVGIWYAQASQQTIVWMANRDQPVQNASGVFHLTADGSLLLSYGKSTVWSSKGNGKKPSSAVIMDSGNLEVLSAENTGEIIWQSFDHPENTWLPGMKVTNTQALSSWRSPWDPSPGPFTLRMDPNGAKQFVLLWKNRTTYWESGVWNGKVFSNFLAWPSYLYNISYFNNGSFEYFTFALTSLSRIVMDKSGQMRVYIMLENKEWMMVSQQPLTQCEVYGPCGPYGLCNNNNLQSCSCVPGFVPRNSQEWESQQWSSGCARKTPLRCSHAENETTTDLFVELSGKSIPPGALQFKGQNRCQEACLTNCSCTAYAYVNCTLKTCKTTLASVVGGVVGGLVAILVFVLLFLWCSKPPRLFATEYTPVGLTVFTYRELQTATKNFSERLGGGGFGAVFKGTLPDGSLVAVKKLEGARQDEKQFCRELSTVGITQHVNLVRLQGFCTEGSQRLLVYEYMINGCLSSFLFDQIPRDDEARHRMLDWKTRFNIAVGTARGIVYLHEKCRDRIIHCDIKPENILLDADFRAKLADFGLSKLLGREYSKVLTTLRGTRGYLAPEWL